MQFMVDVMQFTASTMAKMNVATLIVLCACLYATLPTAYAGLVRAPFVKLDDATVIGTTSSPEKAELAKSYGADYVILYPTENAVERVLEITDGQGVHAVFDGVGKDTSV